MKNSSALTTYILQSIETERNSSTSFSKYLQFIDVPNPLEDPSTLWVVNEVIPSLLELIPGIDPEFCTTRTINQYAKASKLISNIIADDSITENKIAAKKTTFHGLYDSNALFCVLGADHTGAKTRKKYLHLKAQILLSYRRLDTVARHNEKVTSTRYSGCLAARKFGYSNFESLLQKLPEKPISTREYIDKLRGLVPGSDPTYRTDINNLILILRRGLDQEGDSGSPIRKNGSRSKDLGISLSQPHWHPELHLGGDDTPDVNFSIAEHEINSDNDDDLMDSGERKRAPGEAPLERRHRRIALQVNEGPDPNLSQAPLDKLIRSKGYVPALARANQLLATDWENLPTQEISLLIKAIDEEGIYPTGAEIPVKSLSALLSILLWTGFGLETALKIGIKPTGEDTALKKEHPPLLVPETDAAKPYWEYPIKLPKRLGRHPLDAGDRDAILHLPVHPWVYRKVMSLVYQDPASQEANNHNGRRTIFPKIRGCRSQAESQQVYQKAIRTFLSAVNRRYKTHWSVRRLELMFSRILISETDADRVDAQFLTGNMPGAPTNDIYYVRRQISTLMELYQQGQSILAEALNPESQSTDVQGKLFADQATPVEPARTPGGRRTICRENGVGSPFDPDTRDVGNLSASLKHRLITARSQFIGDLSYIDIHNAMTAYTVIMAGFGLGFRAVAYPLKSWTDLDEETGLIVLMDKDGGDGYGARIVWAPDVVREQLVNYKKHMRYVADRIVVESPELQQRISDALQTDSRDHGNPEFDTPFFMLDYRLEPHPCSPSWLDKYLLDFHPPKFSATSGQATGGESHYPLNACRHFLASQMREHGVSEDIVSAHLGHWQFGEEPWCRHSALSPLDYLETLKPILNRLMSECGWIAELGADAE